MINKKIKEAMFYQKLDENKVRCNLCNHRCVIPEGKRGLCKGCGTCVGACLSGAIQQRKFEDRQIMAMIEAYLAPKTSGNEL